MLLASIVLSTVAGYRFAVLSDIHLNLSYSEGCGFPICRDLGWYQLDPPLSTVNLLLDDLNDHYDNIDAIMVLGD